MKKQSILTITITFITTKFWIWFIPPIIFKVISGDFYSSAKIIAPLLIVLQLANKYNLPYYLLLLITTVLLIYAIYKTSERLFNRTKKELDLF